jgi:hypothetical protein
MTALRECDTMVSAMSGVCYTWDDLLLESPLQFGNRVNVWIRPTRVERDHLRRCRH